MKRKIPAVFLLLLTVVFSAVCLFSCKEKDAKPVVITVEEPVATGTTLVEYMDLQGIDYKISNGMVTELDGTKNSTKSFWMLYTTDETNANTAWGTYEYNGATLGSAVLGAGELLVAQGETYVWVYQTF